MNRVLSRVAEYEMLCTGVCEPRERSYLDFASQ